MTIKRGRKVTLYEWKCRCERCGHEWISVGKEGPRKCARCTALNWDKPARPYRKPKKPTGTRSTARKR